MPSLRGAFIFRNKKKKIKKERKTDLWMDPLKSLAMGFYLVFLLQPAQFKLLKFAWYHLSFWWPHLDFLRHGIRISFPIWSVILAPNFFEIRRIFLFSCGILIKVVKKKRVESSNRTDIGFFFPVLFLGWWREENEFFFSYFSCCNHDRHVLCACAYLMRCSLPK